MKRILLTGSTGFIGKNLKELMPDKYELFCPSHKELDLMDGNAVRKFIEMNKIEVVIHAATLNTTKQQVSPSDVLKHNLTMFFNLERCHDLYEKMLYFGSGAEYDRTMGGTVNITEDEFDRSIPQDSYSLSKYLMAKYAQVSDNIYDLCLFGVYGKYEEVERRFISNMILQSKNDGKMIMRQNAIYDYLWIEDLIPIVEWFIENKPKYHRYNVCSGKREELAGIASLVKEYALHSTKCDAKSNEGIKPIGEKSAKNIDIVVEKTGMNSEYTASNERLKKEMPNISFTSVKTGVEKLYEWIFLSH